MSKTDECHYSYTVHWILGIKTDKGFNSVGGKETEPHQAAFVTHKPLNPSLSLLLCVCVCAYVCACIPLNPFPSLPVRPTLFRQEKQRFFFLFLSGVWSPSEEVCAASPAGPGTIKYTKAEFTKKGLICTVKTAQQHQCGPWRAGGGGCTHYLWINSKTKYAIDRARRKREHVPPKIMVR